MTRWLRSRHIPPCLRRCLPVAMVVITCALGQTPKGLAVVRLTTPPSLRFRRCFRRRLSRGITPTELGDGGGSNRSASGHPDPASALRPGEPERRAHAEPPQVRGVRPALPGAGNARPAAGELGSGSSPDREGDAREVERERRRRPPFATDRRAAVEAGLTAGRGTGTSLARAIDGVIRVVSMNVETPTRTPSCRSQS